MIIIWQNRPQPGPDSSPDPGIGYAWNALAKVPGDPPTVPFNSTDTYIPVSGTIDGVNAIFTLAATPTATLQLYRNGIEQTVGSDFTLSANVVTFQPGAVPQPGDVLIAIALMSTAYVTVTGAINGVNASFSIPAPVNFLALYRNGIYQNPGMGSTPGDYVLSGTSITFNAGAIPQTGDGLLAKTQ